MNIIYNNIIIEFIAIYSNNQHKQISVIIMVATGKRQN